MPRGFSLHVGVNELDPGSFSLAPLRGCVNDARAMLDIAQTRGFSESRLLLDKDATFQNVTAALEDAAARLKDEGDVFLFTFSGHGTQVSDMDLEFLEGPDEALVLHDFLLLDDLLGRRYWPKFNKPGVRIISVADSCHSRSITTAPLIEVGIGGHQLLGGGVMTATADFIAPAAVSAEPVVFPVARVLPEEARDIHLGKQEARDFYERVLADLPQAPVEINASTLHIAACRDDQETPDGPEHGVFTEALLGAWAGGSFNGNYEEFVGAIAALTALKPRGRRPVFGPDLGAPLDPPFRSRSPVFAI